MRFTVKIFAIILLTVGNLLAQFPEKRIQDIQWVHPDSLKKADSLQAVGVAFNTPAFPNWIEDSRYWHVPPFVTSQYGDTFTVVGIVMNSPKMYVLGNRYVVFIQDTAGGPWSGIIVLANDTTSPYTQATGIQVLDTGMVVKLVGRVEEFPATSSTGYTELFTVIPDPGTGQIIPIEVLDLRERRPEPIEARVSDFVSGNASAGGHKINFSKGEQWEDVYVVIRNVYVSNRSGTVGGRWTWWISDDSGNVMQVYDGSRYFRGGSGAFDPNWTPPPVGARLEYIRGVIVGQASGYAITPLYPGDVKILAYAPDISHAFTSPQKREPALPKSTDQVKIRAIVKSGDPDPTVYVDTVKLLYSVNYGSFNEVLMTKISGDTLWEGVIPPQPNGSLVRYFFKAGDSKAQWTQLPGDTASNIYFYFVKDEPLKIRDLQYTILPNGNTGFWDLRVTVRGIVTADTTDFSSEVDPSSATGARKTPKVIIQDDSSAWSGIWLYGSRAYIAKRGDLVEVTGIVQESGNVTRILVDSIKVISSGNPIYPAVYVRTGDVGSKPNGTPSSERWEGMLVEFRDVTITNENADSPSNFREFIVDDGTGPCRVNDDGSYTYSTTPADTALGFTILYRGTRISYLRGIFWFSFSNYKLEPRNNDDFGTITKVTVAYKSEIPDRFELLQNYPNPFNPATYIEYRLPERTFVSLKVYNILGQEVATLVDEYQNAGSYRIKFEPRELASGVYFYVLKAGKFTDVKKMILLK